MTSLCKNGHALIPEVVYIRPDGYTECKICRRERCYVYQKKNKEKIKERKRKNALRYYKDNPGKFRKIARDFRRKYPEKIRQNNRTRHSRFKDSLGHYSSWMERYYRFIQNGCCMYCGLPISNTVGVYADDRETLEHIIPLSRGGLHCWSNTSLSCRKCNLQKGSKTSTEFSGDKDGR